MFLTSTNLVKAMNKKPRSTCTQEGIVPSQPGIGCSVHSGQGKHVLHVYRLYGNKFKHLDADGMEFESSEAASRYAYEHGYTREHFMSAGYRARNLANAAERKEMAIKSREWLKKQREQKPQFN